MSLPFSIRARAPSDDAFVAELREGEIAAGFPGLPPQLLATLVPAQRAAFELGLEAHAPFDDLIVERGGQPIGQIAVAERATEQHIVDILLVASERGRGLGAAVLKRFMASASERRVPTRLVVRRSNPALRLYQRLGFSVVASDELHFTMQRSHHPTRDHV